ncbi:MAG: endolytic transglycosylase MltG [Christensenellales bacterium]|jgi:UPF0755 protein
MNNYEKSSGPRLEASERREDKGERVRHVFSNRFLRPLIIFGISLFIVGFLVISAFNYVNSSYIQPADKNDDTGIDFTVEKNSSLSKISKQLEEAGIIKSGMAFKLYADFTDNAYKLKSGKFELKKSMTMDEIIDTLCVGEAQSAEVTVTIVEGKTVEDIATLLHSKGVISSEEDFLKACKDIEQFGTYGFFAGIDEGVSEDRRYALEGYLFPDTYKFFENSEPEAVIMRLLDRFDDIVKEEWISRAEELDMSLDDIVALASMIEKEGRPNDFAKISAVFHNRLRSDMKLESCVTVNYATGVRKVLLSAADIEYDSPYNTNKYTGLPIGPICNPGQAAMVAALYPDEEYIKGKYLFFVTRDPEKGELEFTKTNADHEKAKAKYLPLLEKYQQEELGQ